MASLKGVIHVVIILWWPFISFCGTSKNARALEPENA